MHRLDIARPAAILLEVAGPLTILLAQFVHLGQPFLGGAAAGDQWQALAELLEDPTKTKAFAQYLKEENTG